MATDRRGGIAKLNSETHKPHIPWPRLPVDIEWMWQMVNEYGTDGIILSRTTRAGIPRAELPYTTYIWTKQSTVAFDGLIVRDLSAFAEEQRDKNIVCLGGSALFSALQPDRILIAVIDADFDCEPQFRYSVPDGYVQSENVETYTEQGLIITRREYNRAA